jgi:DNA-binding MarR family transcriptional regulator
MKTPNIAMAIREAYLTMHRQTNLYILKYGITADQFVCMAILDEHHNITQQELVKHATSDPNTIRAMLLLLEKRELIKREDHPNDKRAWVVSLTKKGRQLYKKLDEELIPVRLKMLSMFSMSELNNLYKYLKVISRELNK